MTIRMIRLGLLTLAALSLQACSGESAAKTPERVVDALYDTRGQVAQLPDPDNPISELFIQHEPIPEFKDKDGNVVGMNAMTMEFPALAPGVTLGDIAVGDKVAFQFDVSWDGDPKWSVTRIEKIDPETELNFGAPETPADEATAEQ